MQKEFLYVAHNFPPLIGGGVARTEQNCVLLPQYGWKPTLLTATADNSEETDRKYSHIGIEILRADGIVKENRVRTLPRAANHNKRISFVGILRFFAALFLVPDRQVLWKIPAQRMAIKASSKHNWKCVFGTLYPISAAWIGKIVAKRLKLPFILEYRDVISYEKMNPFRRVAINAIEKALIKDAVKIITVSPGIRDWVSQRHRIDPQDIEVIPTGFLSKDKEYYDSLPKPNNERFTMTYIGTFQRERKPDTVLRAVQNLIETSQMPREKLRVILISNLTQSAVSQYGLDDVVEAMPMMSHDQISQWYAKSDVLLLICDKWYYQNVTYPGKLFEYLINGKPILGLMHKESVTAEVLKKSGIGIVVDAEDIKETATEIRLLYDKWNAQNLSIEPNNEVINSFDYSRLIKKLVSILEETCKD